MWGFVFSVYPFPLWWLSEYIYFVLLSSSNRKYELLLYALFRVRSWNNGVSCMSFCFLVQLCRYASVHSAYPKHLCRWMAPLYGNIFCITGGLWGKSTGHRCMVRRSFDIFLFFVNLNILCNKESSCQYFETQWSYYSLAICYMVWSIMPIYFRTASLVLRESYKYYCPTASEITRNNMDK